MVYLLDLIFFVFLIYVIFLMAYSLIRGAPYAALGEGRTAAMIKLLRVRKGEKIADLGSGDGRIVIALAREGAEAHGYEINPLLVFISRRRIKKAGLSGQAFIHQKSYWGEDLSSFSGVTLYGITHIMPGLGRKLRKELKKGSRVASNHFRFPNWNESESKEDIFLYKI